MLNFVCCTRHKEDSDIKLSKVNGETIHALFVFIYKIIISRTGLPTEDQIPAVTTPPTASFHEIPAKPALKKTVSDSSSVLSVSSFRSVKSTFSTATTNNDDFYSVCSEDSFKSTAPNAKRTL